MKALCWAAVTGKQELPRYLTGEYTRYERSKTNNPEEILETLKRLLETLSQRELNSQE